MEINFWILVVCAFLGLLIGAITGYNPWTILGSVGAIILILPLFLVLTQSDPDVMKSMMDKYIETITAQFPSMIIGEVAGIVAAKIFQVIKGIG